MDKRKNSFIKISNEDIFKEIKGLQENLVTLKVDINTTAIKIARELEDYKTVLRDEQAEQRIYMEELKGMIRLNQWVATSSLAVSLTAIGWITHLAHIV